MCVSAVHQNMINEKSFIGKQLCEGRKYLESEKKTKGRENAPRKRKTKMEGRRKRESRMEQEKEISERMEQYLRKELRLAVDAWDHFAYWEDQHYKRVNELVGMLEGMGLRSGVGR